MTVTGSAPAARGTTTVSERAVQRIATQLVVEMDGVGGAARRLLGVTVADEDAPKVSATVRQEHVTLDVALSVPYPASVARTTEAAREQLVRDVGQLTGLTVDRVDITVTALRGDRAAGRRVR